MNENNDTDHRRQWPLGLSLQAAHSTLQTQSAGPTLGAESVALMYQESRIEQK